MCKAKATSIEVTVTKHLGGITALKDSKSKALDL